MDQSWLNDFEHRLQQLEQRVAQSDVSLIDVVELAKNSFRAFAPDAEPRFLLRDNQQLLEFEGDQLKPAGDDLTAIHRAMDGVAVQWLQTPAPVAPAGERLRVTSPGSLLTQHTLSQQHSFFTLLPDPTLVSSESEAEQASMAVGGLLANQVAQLLLSQMSQTVNANSAILKLSSQLQACRSLDAVHTKVVNESGGIFHSSRLVSLQVDGTECVCRAITGTSVVNRQSAHINALEAMAVVARRQGWFWNSENPKWFRPDELRSQMAGDNPIADNLLADYEGRNVEAVGFFGDSESTGMVIVEAGDSVNTLPTDAVAKWHQQVMAALQRLDHRPARGFRRLVRNVSLWLLPAFTLVSFFIPVDFELAVPGEVRAKDVRSVFAPEDGVVMALFFSNETEVEEGTELLLMENPELALRKSQLEGEISTARAAVAAAEARRLRDSGDSNAAETQLLKQRLKSLVAEAEVVQRRIDELRITSPTAGNVIRRDAAQNLTNRPLRRGQRIAEVIPEDPRWELQLSIPQSYTHYLDEAMAADGGHLELRYLISSSPDQTFEAALEHIEESVTLQQGELIRHAVTDAELPQDAEVRSGTSASVRIRCGQRSLGFVMFRPVIEWLQEMKFTWWG